MKSGERYLVSYRFGDLLYQESEGHLVSDLIPRRYITKNYLLVNIGDVASLILKINSLRISAVGKIFIKQLKKFAAL